ncbi:MAG: hypothetical protein ACK5PQ_04615 [Alphaproteobacteria bacterium]
MRKIGYSSWRFFSSNVFSRVLLPFVALLFSSLKEILISPAPGGSGQGWLSIGLSVAFFYTLYIQLLKRDNTRFSRGDLWMMGLIWAGLAMIVQMTVLYGIYDLDPQLVLNSYAITHLEPWPFALMGLILTPRLAAMVAKKWFF